MKRLLDKEQLIKYNLLTSLEKHKIVNYEVLEENLLLSRKTLKKYLLLLADEIEKNNLEATLKLHLHHVEFDYGVAFTKQSLVTQFILDSLRYKILDYALKSNKQRVNFIEQENISESTFYRLLKDVNRSILANFNIKMNTNTKLLGEEHQIRYFYYCLYLEVGVESEFTTDHYFSPVIKKLETAFNVEITKANKNRFLLLYEICEMRNNQGNLVSITYGMKKVIRNNRVFEILLKKIETEYEKISGDNWLNDFHFMFVMANSFPLLGDCKSIMTLVYSEHVQSKNIMYRYSEKFVDELKKLVNDIEIDITFKSKLIQIYIRMLVFEGFFIDDEHLKYDSYFREHRPLLKLKLKQIFEELTGYFKDDNDDFFLFIHSVMLDNTIEYSKLLPAAKIGLESSRDPIFLKFYSRQIQNHLLGEFELVMEPYSPEETYDIVLSDQYTVHDNTKYSYSVRFVPTYEQAMKIKLFLTELNKAELYNHEVDHMNL
ncbi:helix-turn-helix domain-containing protein [Brochothrix thermosphacta]|uniref:helix-turn-helix domain-containing protein n=1 Tax=Brochothrix thermosphacta TaxID=2756 RepID=UPI00271413A8|nr:helix-turn-helix domain-containing protein [Brochothrix thermosphacta]MDO7864133.1 helix-turn-helix domain-containing protein [Brochothrix thermosphacta]